MPGTSAVRQYLALAIAASVLFGNSVSAQSTTSNLPANWKQLSPTDFATLVQQYFDQGTFSSLSVADQNSLAAQGAALFTQIKISTTTVSYQTLQTLDLVGQAKLDQWVLAQAKGAIMARHDGWAAKPYAENRSKVLLMMQLGVPDPVWLNEARQWVLAGGTQTQVPQSDLVYDLVRQMFADVKVIDGSFSVEWVGQVNAPQTGDYTFSISPIDVNVGFAKAPVSVSMTVFLARQAMIDATPPAPADALTVTYTYKPGQPHKSSWVSQSNAVSLTAGTPVNLRVVVSVDAQSLPSGVLHAMLFWQGPGISRSLVPANAFSQAQGGGPGLKATYAWTANGQPQSLSRIDPMIDFAWTGSPILLGEDPTSANQSADAMWQAMTAPTFIADYANTTPTVKLHPFLREPGDASCGLSTSRRQAFLDLLLQNPTLLDAIDATRAVSFFQAFRVGTPEKALNVFGAWAARKADLTCELTPYRFFDEETRSSLAGMATLTTQQLPNQSARLQQEFLQLADGRCSLPVAYTLTYSYLGRGKLNDWLAVLDAKLADPVLTGDIRVNWLLARAQAQEFTRRAIVHYPYRFSYPFSWPLDGKHYLYEALTAAQSPWVKVRVAKEIAARLTSAGQYQAAEDFLGQLVSSLPASQKTVVLGWQQEIAGFVTAQAFAIQSQQTEATKAYVHTLEERRARAASQGNSAAVSRYDALISAALNH
jgi:PA14 domain